ncbi:hypothetical protein Tco_1233444, partial [Tanacetum coccineum]
MSRSPEPRRDRSRSPRRKDMERDTMFKRLEKGIFHRLDDKEKGGRMSESEDSAGGHRKFKSKSKGQVWRMRTYPSHSHVKTYDGSEDPEDHLKIFQAAAK